MSYIFRHFWIFFFLLISACTTNPVNETKENSAQFLVAKQFIHNIGAGEMGLIAVKQMINDMYEKEPNAAEFTQRIFGDVSTDDFDNIIANVYQRHLSYEDLHKLAQDSDNPVISKYFALAFEQVLIKKQNLKPNNLMNQFTADELTVLLRFLKGDNFQRLGAALPEINRELKEEGRKFGEQKLNDYLENHPDPSKDTYI